jgi:hypothetical protein
MTELNIKVHSCFIWFFFKFFFLDNTESRSFIQTRLFDSFFFYTPVVRQEVPSYGVVRPFVRDRFTIFWTFLPSLQLLHWNSVYCFVVKSCSSNLHSGLIYLFLQELRPLNLEKFKNFSVPDLLHSHLCSNNIETWFIVLKWRITVRFAFLVWLVYFSKCYAPWTYNNYEK